MIERILTALGLTKPAPEPIPEPPLEAMRLPDSHNISQYHEIAQEVARYLQTIQTRPGLVFFLLDWKNEVMLKSNGLTTDEVRAQITEATGFATTDLPGRRFKLDVPYRHLLHDWSFETHR